MPFSPIWMMGCAGPATYSLSVDELEKDALRVRVHVDRQLELNAYEEIARRELGEVRRLPRTFDAPLYRVEFVYFAPAATTEPALPVASYVWTNEEPIATQADVVSR